MDITADECRELLNYLRFQIRGTGWVSVDEILTEEFSAERIDSNPFLELRAYLFGVQERITARSAYGVNLALASLNQTLGEEGIRQVTFDSGEGEPRSLVELLPTEENLSGFLNQLRELEYLIGNARYLDEREEMGGPSVTT